MSELGLSGPEPDEMECPFGEGEAGLAGLRGYLRRKAKLLIETDDPVCINAAAKLIAESIRCQRLERDFKKDRLEAAEVARLEEMANRIANVRGHH